MINYNDKLWKRATRTVRKVFQVLVDECEFTLTVELALVGIWTGPLSTNPFTMPRFDVEKDVIAPFCAIAKALRNHHIVFGQPQLQFLVVSPVAVMTTCFEITADKRLGVQGTYSSWAAITC